MKLQVDLDVCEGHGLCAMAAPGVFDLDDDGHAVLLQESPPTALLGQVKEAAQSCPKAAIRLLSE